MTGLDRNALRITGSSWSKAVTEAQRWAWGHGCVLVLTRDQMVKLDALWERLGGDGDAFVQQLESGALS